MKGRKSFARRYGPALLLLFLGTLTLGVGLALPGLAFLGFHLPAWGLGAIGAGLSWLAFERWLDGKWVNWKFAHGLLRPSQRHGPGRPLGLALGLLCLGTFTALLASLLGSSPDTSVKAGLVASALGGAALVTYGFALGWSNIQGSPFVTVGPTAASSNGQLANLGATYGPDTAGTTTSGIQEAVNAAGSGFVYLLQGVFLITSEITPNATGNLMILGSGWGQDPAHSTPYSIPKGCIVQQQTAAKSIFHATTQMNGLYLRDFVLSFKSGLASTGHGLFLDVETWLAGTSPGTFYAQIMVNGYELHNLLVQGHDMGHYGFYLGNVLEGTCSNLQTSGGGWVRFEGYAPAGATATLNSGNTIIGGYNGAWVTGAATVNIFDLYVNNLCSTSLQVNFVRIIGKLDIGLAANLAGSGNIISFGSSAHGYTALNNIDDLAVGDLGAWTCGIYVAAPNQNSIRVDQPLPASVSLAGSALIVIRMTMQQPYGFGATATPAVGATTVDVQNTNPFPVRIYILTPGSVTTDFAITDPSGTKQAMGVAPVAGQQVTLDPGAKIQFTYTGSTPTWKWYGT